MSSAEQVTNSEREEDSFEIPPLEIDEIMVLRKRRGWDADSLHTDFEIPEDSDDELVEEDEAGCPLPSTPEDTQLIEAEVSFRYFCYFYIPSFYC